jgi:hypothetical protein
MFSLFADSLSVTCRRLGQKTRAALGFGAGNVEVIRDPFGKIAALTCRC